MAFGFVRRDAWSSSRAGCFARRRGRSADTAAGFEARKLGRQTRYRGRLARKSVLLARNRDPPTRNRDQVPGNRDRVSRKRDPMPRNVVLSLRARVPLAEKLIPVVRHGVSLTHARGLVTGLPFLRTAKRGSLAVRARLSPARAFRCAIRPVGWLHDRVGCLLLSARSTHHPYRRPRRAFRQQCQAYGRLRRTCRSRCRRYRSLRTSFRQ